MLWRFQVDKGEALREDYEAEWRASSTPKKVGNGLWIDASTWQGHELPFSNKLGQLKGIPYVFVFPDFPFVSRVSVAPEMLGKVKYALSIDKVSILWV